MRVQLPLVVHQRGDRQRLAAAASAKVQRLLARLRAAGKAGELRALVLNFDITLHVGGLGIHRRAAAVGLQRNAHADGRQRAGFWLQVLQLFHRPGAVALVDIDAQVERRAGGQRRALIGGIGPESSREMGGEPFRIIAAHMVGRALQRAGGKVPALRLGQWRRRMRLAAEQRRDGRAVQPARQFQRTDHGGARIVRRHQPLRGGALAQRVKHQARDKGAVFGAGKAVRRAPVLQCIGGGAALQIGHAQHFNGGGNMGGRQHCRKTIKETWN